MEAKGSLWGQQEALPLFRPSDAEPDFGARVTTDVSGRALPAGRRRGTRDGQANRLAQLRDRPKPHQQLPQHRAVSYLAVPGRYLAARSRVCGKSLRNGAGRIPRFAYLEPGFGSYTSSRMTALGRFRLPHGRGGGGRKMPAGRGREATRRARPSMVSLLSLPAPAGQAVDRGRSHAKPCLPLRYHAGPGRPKPRASARALAEETVETLCPGKMLYLDRARRRRPPLLSYLSRHASVARTTVLLEPVA